MSSFNPAAFFAHHVPAITYSSHSTSLPVVLDDRVLEDIFRGVVRETGQFRKGVHFAAMVKDLPILTLNYVTEALAHMHDNDWNYIPRPVRDHQDEPSIHSSVYAQEQHLRALSAQVKEGFLKRHAQELYAFFPRTNAYQPLRAALR